MKLWEVISAFRDDADLLRQVFASDRWRPSYFDLYANFSQLVQGQDRGLLDTLLPIELTREIAARYDQATFFFYPEKQLLRRAGPDYLPNLVHVKMTALEVHDRFGGSVIEEVMEYGSAYVAQ